MAPRDKQPTGPEGEPLRALDLNDYLSADNVWTRRLVGMEAFRQTRTPELVEREYDREFYGPKLEAYREDPEALRRQVLEGEDREIHISLGERVFLAPARTYHAIKRERMHAILGEHGRGTPLCELGAGYGANFIWLQKKFQVGDLYGGEFSRNARRLAERLGFEVHPFDFFDPESYGFIRPGTTVYTCHAVEQVPDATVVVDSLRRLRDRVRCVVHFEPLYGARRANLLGLLRDRYAELNDYNRNLLDCVENGRDIEVLRREADLFGNNPLNPAGILVWRFMK